MSSTASDDTDRPSIGQRFGALVLRSVMRCLAALGPAACRRLSSPLAAVVWRTNARRRHSTRCNLEIAFPELPAESRDALGKASTRHYVRNILEGGIAWYWPERRIAERFDPPLGLVHLETAQAAGRGVIIALPHFGAWELLGLHLGPRIDGGILYKPSRSATLDRLLLERRSRFGLRMLPATPAGLRRLYAELTAGRTVGVLPDQEPSSGQGRFAPFFGRAALTAVLIPRLVQATGARVVFAAGLRTEQGRYRAQLLAAEPAVHDRDVDAALAALNRGVEACVALDPPQYLWAYKRWRHRPPGDAAVY